MLTYIASHLGWRVDCVLSGSMEPELHTGSLAVTQPVNPGSIQAGDIITFHDNSGRGILITHRVTEVWDNNPVYYQTKGDACEQDDPFIVSSKNLVGKVTFNLPVAGYFIYFLKTPVGFVVSIVIPTSILLLTYIRSIWQEIKRYRERRASEAVK